MAPIPIPAGIPVHFRAPQWPEFHAPPCLVPFGSGVHFLTHDISPPHPHTDPFRDRMSSGPDSPPRRTRRTPGERTRPVTLTDVAAMAGVSPMTVSRVLNQPDKVAPATVQKVQEVIARSGFVPNLLAGGLSSQRSRLVAAIVPQMVNSIFIETLQAFSQVLWQEGYQVLIGMSGYPESREDELVTTILARRPEAIYLTGVERSDATRRRLAASGIPVVEVWDLTPTPLDLVVGFSHEACGQAVATHLLDRGYRRLGLVWADDPRAAARMASLQQTLAQAGLAQAPAVVGPAPSTTRKGRDGLAQLLASGQRFDAIACSSDALAQGVLAEALSRGLRIPQDLAVIGFGDLEAAANTYPTLTTIRIFSTEIGRNAAEGLLQRMRGERPPQPAIVDTGFSLIQREST